MKLIALAIVCSVYALCATYTKDTDGVIPGILSIIAFGAILFNQGE